MVPRPSGSGITGPAGMGCSLALPEQEWEATPSTPAGVPDEFMLRLHK